MTSRFAQRCGAFTGLALLLCAHSDAGEILRQAIRGQCGDDSYVLVEDSTSIRLYLLSEPVDAAALPQAVQPPPGSVDAALSLTRSADTRARVRGLTLLAGATGAAARDAALTLLNDPAETVREEAYMLLLDHPAVNHASIVTMGNADPSPRVREAVAAATGEDGDD